MYLAFNTTRVLNIDSVGSWSAVAPHEQVRAILATIVASPRVHTWPKQERQSMCVDEHHVEGPTPH